MLRVLVVDDQRVIRAGLTMIVDHEEDLTVVGEAGDGEEALRVAAAAAPDVVLMDIRMPLMDGIEATRRLRESARPPAVLVLTTFEDDEYVFGALRAGAAGFLLKDATPDALVEAIRTVGRGDALVDPAVTGRLVARWSDLEGTASPRRTLPDGLLTEREQEILIAMARGGSNREIAAQVYVSEATVKSHVSSLLTKLGVASRVQAVIMAYELGLVQPGDPDNLGWLPPGG